MIQPTPNPFERARRLEKVLALVEVIDQQARRAGVDPHASAAYVAVLIGERWTPANWTRVAVLAGKRPPSEETRRLVREVYERRAGGAS